MSRILVIGGSPASLLNFMGALMAALRQRGHEVLAASGGADQRVEAGLGRIGVAYHTLPLQRTALNPLQDILLILNLCRLMHKERVDVVLAYTVKAVVYGLIAARIVGISRRHALVSGLGYAFMDGPESAAHRALGALVKGLYRFALRGSSTVFFQNNDDRQVFRELGLLDARSTVKRVMGSGVDLEHFAHAPLPEGAPVFLMVSRLLADKGVREFVSAARTVRALHPEATCALLGPFDSNPAAISRLEVEAWIREGAVEYWGETDDVRPCLKRATVVVLPSYREGLPRSVLEAMAMGRPVITTDAPGCRDAVEVDVTGFLVPVRDADALAATMKECLKSQSVLKQMGEASRKRAESTFGVGSVNREMIEAMGL